MGLIVSTSIKIPPQYYIIIPCQYIQIYNPDLNDIYFHRKIWVSPYQQLNAIQDLPKDGAH